MNTLEEAWSIIRETDLLIKALSKEAALSRQEMDRRSQETDRKFQETDRKFQETDRKFQETDHQFQETRLLIQELSRESDRKFEEMRLSMKALSQETDRRFHETDLKFQETARKFQETDLKFKETDLKFQETARRFEETRQLINATNGKLGKLGNRLGEFVEGLIKPSVVRLFQERGIMVHKVLRDIEASNPNLGLATQIDLLAINLDTCILIEVKSRLSPEDINDHWERMNKFKPLFPEYHDKRVLGALAGMVMADEVVKHAYRKGFFVIGQRGEDAVILNDEQFQPSVW